MRYKNGTKNNKKTQNIENCNFVQNKQNPLY